MRLRSALVLTLALGAPLRAEAPRLRPVERGVLVSAADPAVTLAFAPAFAYAGGQTIDILKVAGAEQHFFVDAAPDRSIRRFYWVQFEAYYPDNAHTYDYSRIPQKPVALGRLAFMGDVRVRPNYFTMDDRPGSDSKAAEVFLKARGFRIDGTFVTLRLFHLPDASRRRELMIIYGEVLPDDAATERMKSEITAHAQANVEVR